MNNYFYMRLLALVLLFILIFLSFGCVVDNNSNNDLNFVSPSDSYSLYESGHFSFKYNNNLLLESKTSFDDNYQIMLLKIPSSEDKIKVSVGHYPEEITIEEICNKLNPNSDFEPEIIKEKNYSKCTFERFFEEGLANTYMRWTIVFDGNNQYNFEYYSFFESEISVEKARELSSKKINAYFIPIIDSIAIDYSPKTFDQNGIKFNYSRYLEPHLGGIMNNPATILNLVSPYPSRSTITIQQGVASQDSFTNDLCESLNDETTNNIDLTKLGQLDACKVDYNSSYNGAKMHCLQYITIQDKLFYSVNYCMGVMSCDQNLKVVGEITDCDAAQMSDAVLFNLDMNYYLNTIINSFEIVE